MEEKSTQMQFSEANRGLPEKGGVMMEKKVRGDENDVYNILDQINL